MFVFLETVVVYKMGIETCLESPWWHFASARCQLLQCVAFGGAWEFSGSNSTYCAAGGKSLPSVRIDRPTAQRPRLHAEIKPSNWQFRTCHDLGDLPFLPSTTPLTRVMKDLSVQATLGNIGIDKLARIFTGIVWNHSINERCAERKISTNVGSVVLVIAQGCKKKHHRSKSLISGDLEHNNWNNWKFMSKI